MKLGSEKGKVTKSLKVYSAKKVTEALGRQSQRREIETIISTDLLELLVLLCSIIMQLRLRNDLYCVGWGVELYSLTHSL